MTTKTDSQDIPQAAAEAPGAQAFAEAAQAVLQAAPVAEDKDLADRISASIDLMFAKAAGNQVH